MAVAEVTTLTVKPDRLEAYVDRARKFKAAIEREGAKNVRLLSAVVAGEATGSLAFIAEYDSFAAAGAGIDALMASAQGAESYAVIQSSESPVENVQTAFWVDVPL